MTTAIRRIEEVPLDSIRDHPRNLRREIGDVSELACQETSKLPALRHENSPFSDMRAQ